MRALKPWRASGANPGIAYSADFPDLRGGNTQGVLVICRDTMKATTNFRICGPDMSPYQLGAPMHIFDDDRLLGMLDPVLVSADGTSVHIEHFHPSDFVRTAEFHVGRLIFLEICAFLCHTFNNVGAISFVFSRKVDVLGSGTQQALARADIMTRIGATEITIGPKPDRLPGHFAISGVWQYSDRTLPELLRVLEEERRHYAAWKGRLGGGGLRRVLGMLLRPRGQRP